VLAFNDYPQETFLKTCAVLAEKRGRASAAAAAPARRHGATGGVAKRGAVPVASLTPPDRSQKAHAPRRTRVGA
jgi:hypothetical protein